MRPYEALPVGHGPDAFVTAARSLRGTRWRHRGRKPWAVDCVGLVALAGAKSGLPGEDVRGYGREPWEDSLRSGCRERWGAPLPVDQAQPGDVALVRWGAGEPSHMGIVARHPDGHLSVIHSHNLHGVIEQSLVGRLRQVVFEVYRPWVEVPAP
jgi:cell wall-associated NlpC family hydrolase